jgi:hypothetical protein
MESVAAERSEGFFSKYKWLFIIGTVIVIVGLALGLGLGLGLKRKPSPAKPEAGSTADPPAASTPQVPAAAPASTPQVPAAAPASTPQAPASTVVPYSVKWDNESCFTPTASLGYAGVQTLDAMKAGCDSKPLCKGFVKHGGGDYWYLKDVNTRKPSPGAVCYQK